MINKIDNDQCFSLSLIGPSASGKTTVSDELFKRLKKTIERLKL